MCETQGYAFEPSCVRDNRMLSASIGVVTLEAPVVAARVAPGQFIHLRLEGMDAQVLRRPYSVFDADTGRGTIEVMYQTVGVGSRFLSRCGKGHAADLIGPLGTGWQVPEDARKALLVCGGLGAAPLTMLARRLKDAAVETDLVIGARDEDALRCHGRILELADRTHVATDDGSVGLHGFCTELSAALLADQAFDYMAICGPEPMMRIVATQALEADAAVASAQVSLEKRMACGVGACLSCIVETRAGRMRSCVDGPVFDVREVVW